MTRSEAIITFRWRQTVIDNLDSIIGAVKSSQKADLSSQGQLDLFGAGLEVERKVGLIPHKFDINVDAFVNAEIELIGLPVTYNPLDEYEMHQELFCTHDSTELLGLNAKTQNIIYLDRVVDIEHCYSKKGNRYGRLKLFNLGDNMDVFLFGSDYHEYVREVFKDQIYMFKLEFNVPTPKFDGYSTVCKYLKKADEVDLVGEYERLIKNME